MPDADGPGEFSGGPKERGSSGSVSVLPVSRTFTAAELLCMSPVGESNRNEAFLMSPRVTFAAVPEPNQMAYVFLISVRSAKFSFS